MIVELIFSFIISKIFFVFLNLSLTLGNGPENTPHRTGSVSSASPRRKSSATPRNAPAIASVPVYRFSSSSESEKGKDEESENEMIFRPTLSVLLFA